MLRGGANLIILCLQGSKSHSFYGHFGDNSYRNVKSLKIPGVDTLIQNGYRRIRGIIS